MLMISLQMLLINFIVAGVVTATTYILFKEIRKFNPFLVLSISSLGSFLGTIIAAVLPTFNLFSHSIFLNNLINSIPGVILAFLFSIVWLYGSKTEGYI